LQGVRPALARLLLATLLSTPQVAQRGRRPLMGCC